MSETDLIRVRHMLEYAQNVVRLIEGHSQDELGKNIELTWALTYGVAIIGEAAAHVEAEMRQKHPEIPWPQIIGMRNRLFHGYFEIYPERLWATVTQAIPELIPQLEAILKLSSSLE